MHQKYILANIILVQNKIVIFDTFRTLIGSCLLYFIYLVVVNAEKDF